MVMAAVWRKEVAVSGVDVSETGASAGRRFQQAGLDRHNPSPAVIFPIFRMAIANLMAAVCIVCWKMSVPFFAGLRLLNLQAGW
jgi:hypothetical protein